jgi:F-type H+-transporting ATPase subunit a
MARLPFCKRAGAIAAVVLLFLLLQGPAAETSAKNAAQSAKSFSISAILLGHVLDSRQLAVFPALPSITLPFGMTVHMLMLALTVIGLAFTLTLGALRHSLKPRGIALAVEMTIVFIRDEIVYSTFGEKRGEKWLPFFSTLFILIFTLNMAGLVPAFKAATGNFAVTSALALLVLILIFIASIARLGLKGFLANFWPSGSPAPIGALVWFLEFAGIIIKSAVLSLRLFVNMFAGHLAILAFLSLIFVLSPAAAGIALPFAVFVYLLEVLVALIQAYVFTLLSCIFTHMASTSHDAAHENG